MKQDNVSQQDYSHHKGFQNKNLSEINKTFCTIQNIILYKPTFARF